MADTEDCSYDAPTTIDSTGNVRFGRSGQYPLDVELRRVRNWDAWDSSTNGPVCPATSQSIADVRNRRGNLIFADTPDDVYCHPSLYQPLRSFIENTSYFSDTYGPQYGPITILGLDRSQRNALRYKTVEEADGTKVKRVRGSYHYVGKALDIYWIEWNGADSAIAARPCNGASEALDAASRRRLVAVEAGLRKWFGYVLNRNIDDHQHHFHVDNGCPEIALRLKKDSTRWQHTSCHFFIQDCIAAFTDVTVNYDGSWDPKTPNGHATREGYRTLLSDLGMERLDPRANCNEYILFLDYIMMHGFANARAGEYRWAGRTSPL